MYILKYKNLEIFAIEPDYDNSNIFRLNLADQNFQLFEGALSFDNSPLYLEDNITDPIAYRVGFVGNKRIPSISVNEILENQKLLLKQIKFENLIGGIKYIKRTSKRKSKKNSKRNSKRNYKRHSKKHSKNKTRKS